MSIANIDGFTYSISSASGENLTRQGATVVRAGGTANSAFLSVPIERPASFDGSSNDGISDASIAVQDGLDWASSVHAVSGATQTRELQEINLGNPLVEGDKAGGLNTKLSDRELLYGSILADGPLIQRRDGSWVNATGANVSITSSGLPSWEIIANSGDAAAYRGRTHAQEYTQRVGIASVQQSLGIRTQ